MKKVSLRDIAEELGVSKTLVSLVMNGKAEENRISQEVIERVKRVAKEKGYEPNQFAKALRTGKSMTIGLIVADISNSFYSKMARSIEDTAYGSNYTVLFGSSDEDPAKAWILLKAVEKPMVSLVWIGIFLIMTGFSISILRRRKQTQDITISG